MELNSRLGTIGKVTGVAASTAPFVRRLATDDELRSDVTDFIASANHLVRDLVTDKQLRKDAGRVVAAAQNSSRHIRHDARPRGHTMFWVGTGMVLGVLAIAGALLYPRTRRSVVHAADQTVQRASATVHDVREAISRRTSGTAPGEYTAPSVSTGHGQTGDASQAA